MKRETDYSDVLDNDFEVTYEDGWEDVSVSCIGRQSRDDYTDYQSRHKIRKGVPLAAPIRKGGRVLSRVTTASIRCLTTVLILSTTAYVTYTFWRASTPYGDITESIRTGEISMTLSAYICIALIFLLFEFISLMWSMTKIRMRDDSGSWKADAGRGLYSFIFVFVSSYLSFLFYRFLPESPEILYGLKGSLEVYGSMHNVLFGLCAAGVISCLVRKHFLH